MANRDQIGLVDHDPGKVQEWEIRGWIRKLTIKHPDWSSDAVHDQALKEAAFWRKLPGQNDSLLGELAFYDHHGVWPEWHQDFPTPEERKSFEAVLFAWQDGQPLSAQPSLKAVLV